MWLTLQGDVVIAPRLQFFTRVEKLFRGGVFLSLDHGGESNDQENCTRSMQHDFRRWAVHAREGECPGRLTSGASSVRLCCAAGRRVWASLLQPVLLPRPGFHRRTLGRKAVWLSLRPALLRMAPVTHRFGEVSGRRPQPTRSVPLRAVWRSQETPVPEGHLHN